MDFWPSHAFVQINVAGETHPSRMQCASGVNFSVALSHVDCLPVGLALVVPHARPNGRPLPAICATICPCVDDLTKARRHVITPT